MLPCSGCTCDTCIGPSFQHLHQKRHLTQEERVSNGLRGNPVEESLSSELGTMRSTSTMFSVFVRGYRNWVLRTWGRGCHFLVTPPEPHVELPIPAPDSTPDRTDRCSCCGRRSFNTSRQEQRKRLPPNGPNVRHPLPKGWGQ